ncbi:hypothetical protein Tco_1500932 [Tanacetum coccineum]
MPGCSWRGHLRGVHIHYCPGVLGGDTCEGYIFIPAWVFLEGTPAIGTYGFHYCPGVLGGDTYDVYIMHRLSHKLSRELLPFVELYSGDIVSRNVLTLCISSQFVIVIVVMVALLGPGAVPACTTLSDSETPPCPAAISPPSILYPHHHLHPIVTTTSPSPPPPASHPTSPSPQPPSTSHLITSLPSSTYATLLHRGHTIISSPPSSPRLHHPHRCRYPSRCTPSSSPPP